MKKKSAAIQTIFQTLPVNGATTNLWVMDATGTNILHRIIEATFKLGVGCTADSAFLFEEHSPQNIWNVDWEQMRHGHSVSVHLSWGWGQKSQYCFLVLLIHCCHFALVVLLKKIHFKKWFSKMFHNHIVV